MSTKVGDVFTPHKDVLELDRVLASAYAHGRSSSTLSFEENKKRTTAIRLQSLEFLEQMQAAYGAPAAWRTFDRAANCWRFRDDDPGETYELSPEYEPLYTAADLLAALKMGIGIGLQLRNAEKVENDQPQHPDPSNGGHG